ncbi:MAG: DUF4292 domain-containing protein [Bacteroidota bacterium]
MICRHFFSSAISKAPLFSLLSIALLLGLSSCKGGKKARTVELKEKPARYVMKRMEQNALDVEWLSGKGTIFYRDQEQSVRGRFNIRLRKDSVIWMNVKKYSIEGARMLITKDSVFAIDRLGKAYFAKDFDFVRRQYNLPADFESLQAMLLGNPVFMPQTKYIASVDKNDYRLSGDDQNLQQAYWIDGLFFQLRKIYFAEPSENRQAVIEQKDFQPIGEKRNFSYLRTLKLKSPDTGELSIEMNFSKVEINTPKSIRFEIPSHYTRLD